MVPAAQRPRLLAIVGPTASGKSGLAMRLAKEFDGEIICADSRTIYKSMDIGTAKPTKKEQAEVPHWGLDLVKPGQTFSAAKFKNYAEKAIMDVQNRGKLPILVGGTGLYIDGVLYDYSFSLAARERDPINPRHLKKMDSAERNTNLWPRTLILGLLPADDELKERISSRAQKMFKRGIVKEAKDLLDEYGQKAVSGTAGIAYQAVIELIDGEIDRQQAIEAIKTKEWQYARRQKTWFKRNAHIKWFNGAEQAYKVIQKQLLNT